MFAVVTSGGGLTVTLAKGFIKEAVEVLSKIVGKVVSGILKIVEKIAAVFGKVVEAVKGAIKFVAGKLKEAGAKFVELFEGVGDFFKTLLKSCHESKLVCDFLEKAIEKLRKIDKASSGAMKELAGRIHQLNPELTGQSIAVIEVNVDGTIRYAAATNSGANFGKGWAKAQETALKGLDIERIPTVGGKIPHAEANVQAWVQGLKNAGAKKVQIVRWGVSAGEKGGFICPACRQIQTTLGGFVEEFSALGKTS